MEVLSKIKAIRISANGKIEPKFDPIATGKAEWERVGSERDEAMNSLAKRYGEAWEKASEEDRLQTLYAHLGADVFKRYVIERDVSKLCFSGDPVYFHVDRPSVIWLLESAGRIHSQSEKRLHAFRSLCHLITEGDKTLFECVPPDRNGKYKLVTASDGTAVSGPDFLEAVRNKFGAEVIAEMGQLALDMAELSEVNKAPFGWWGGSVARPS